MNGNGSTTKSTSSKTVSNEDITNKSPKESTPHANRVLQSNRSANTSYSNEASDSFEDNPDVCRLSRKSHKSRTLAHNYILGLYFESPSFHQEYAAFTTRHVQNLANQSKRYGRDRLTTRQQRVNRRDMHHRMPKIRPNMEPRTVPHHPSVPVSQSRSVVKTHSKPLSVQPLDISARNITDSQGQDYKRGGMRATPNRIPPPGTLSKIIAEETVSKVEDDRSTIAASTVYLGKHYGDPSNNLDCARRSFEEEQTAIILDAIRVKIDDKKSRKSVKHKRCTCRCCKVCGDVTLMIFIIAVSLTVVIIPIVLQVAQFLHEKI